MSMEAGVVVDLDGNPIRWHLPPGRTGGSLPDSRELWEFVWENRARISGIAHSHPGGGLPGPSHEDVTTFAAIEDALGKRLSWWIATEDRLIVARWKGPHRYSYSAHEITGQTPWLKPLREASKELTDARLEEECDLVMEMCQQYVQDLRAGNAALAAMTEAVLKFLPHASAEDVKRKIQDLLERS